MPLIASCKIKKLYRRGAEGAEVTHGSTAILFRDKDYSQRREIMGSTRDAR